MYFSVHIPYKVHVHKGIYNQIISNWGFIIVLLYGALSPVKVPEMAIY